MKHIRVEVPTRIDLAGGTLDIWPLFQLVAPCATVNFGVTLTAQIDMVVHDSPNHAFHIHSQDQQKVVSGTFFEVIQDPNLPLLSQLLRAIWKPDLPPFSMVSCAKSPAGAGLGGSSALGVAIAKALWIARSELTGELEPDEAELIDIVRDVEARLIWAPTGIQDYWGAVRGGLNIISYRPGRVLVETLRSKAVEALQTDLLVCYSGRSRASADNNWRIFRAVFEKDAQVLKSIGAIAEAAFACGEAFKEGDFRAAMTFSMREWAERCSLWPSITTAETVRIEAAANTAGAYFTRICGAGGGGVMAIFAPPEKHPAVKVAVNQVGGVVLDAKVSLEGLSCSRYESG